MDHTLGASARLFALFVEKDELGQVGVGLRQVKRLRFSVRFVKLTRAFRLEYVLFRCEEVARILRRALVCPPRRPFCNGCIVGLCRRHYIVL